MDFSVIRTLGVQITRFVNHLCMFVKFICQYWQHRGDSAWYHIFSWAHTWSHLVARVKSKQPSCEKGCGTWVKEVVKSKGGGQKIAAMMLLSIILNNLNGSSLKMIDNNIIASIFWLPPFDFTTLFTLVLHPFSQLDCFHCVPCFLFCTHVTTNVKHLLYTSFVKQITIFQGNNSDESNDDGAVPRAPPK